jgi:hypothetical protein
VFPFLFWWFCSHDVWTLEKFADPQIKFPLGGEVLARQVVCCAIVFPRSSVPFAADLEAERPVGQKQAANGRRSDGWEMALISKFHKQ